MKYPDDVKLLQELLVSDGAVAEAFVDLMDSISTHSGIIAAAQPGDRDGPVKSSEYEVASDLVALWRAFERAKAAREDIGGRRGRPGDSHE